MDRPKFLGSREALRQAGYKVLEVRRCAHSGCHRQVLVVTGPDSDVEFLLDPQTYQLHSDAVQVRSTSRLRK